MHRPNFVSPLSELVLQSEFPRGYKIPKFTKFAGDTSESTVEHIARYLTEAGDLANDENLRLKFFPNSLTKYTFTWFTTLAPHLIQHWIELERLFHEKFYRGQSNFSLKELASVNKSSAESVDDYPNRFRLLKARCFIQVLEPELVQMAAGGLDYSIRKKLDTQHLRDMAQLADRVRHVERLKAEKARTHKHFRTEKVAFVASDESNQEFDISFGDVEIKEVDIAELKPGLPYTCKSLRPSNGNNHVETSNERYVPKTYTFDVTKCDEIYDLLVADGQVVAPKDVKIPPLEQCQKRDFCKYHNLLGHNTSRCSLFRGLVHKGLNEGRLKFGNKPKPQMQVDSDPLKDVSMMYTDIAGYNMIEAIIDVVENLSVEAEAEVRECQMVDITKYAGHVEQIALEPQFDEKLKTAYPTSEEELIDFLNRCKLKNYEVMLCPKCSVVFDKEATKGLESSIPKPKKRGKWYGDHRPKFSFTKSYIPFINNSSTTNYVNQSGQGKNLVPYAPNPKWVQSTHKNVQHGKNNMVKRNTSVVDNNNNGIAFESRKFTYSNNYRGKNLMTRTQWRTYQRSKKCISTSLEDETVDPKGDQRGYLFL